MTVVECTSVGKDGRHSHSRPSRDSIIAVNTHNGDASIIVVLLRNDKQSWQ